VHRVCRQPFAASSLSLSLSLSLFLSLSLSLVARRPPRRRQFASGASPLIDFLQLSLVVSRAARTDGAAATWGCYRLFCFISLFSHQIFVIDRAPRPGIPVIFTTFENTPQDATVPPSLPPPSLPPSLNFSSRHLVIVRHRVTTQTAIPTNSLEFRVANTSRLDSTATNRVAAARACLPSPSRSCLVFSP